MRKINLQTKIMAYLSKDNHGHKYLNPVQANYIRTHIPDAGDLHASSLLMFVRPMVEQ